MLQINRVASNPNKAVIQLTDRDDIKFDLGVYPKILKGVAENGDFYFEDVNSFLRTLSEQDQILLL